MPVSVSFTNSAIKDLYPACRERSGPVVEWLTQDRGAASSSLTGVVVLEQDTFILA